MPGPHIAEPELLSGGYLTEADMPWLITMIGNEEAVDTLLPALERHAEAGSIPLGQIPDSEKRDEAFASREQFLTLLGIEDSALEALRQSSQQRAYLVPSRTFIEAQRAIQNYDINPERAYRRTPNILNCTREWWESQIDEVESMSEMEKVPAYYRPDLVTNPPFRAGIKHLAAIGIDPQAVLRKRPPIRVINTEFIDERIDNLTERGLDAKRVIVRNPDILTMSPDKAIAKLENLAELGLDEVKLVHKYPNIMSSNETAIARKMRLVTHIGSALQWEGDVVDLVQASPNILTASEKKIEIFGHAVAIAGDTTHRTDSIPQVRTNAIIPIESYIIALDDYLDKKNGFTDVFTQGKRITRQLSAPERKQVALQALENHPVNLADIARLYAPNDKNKE